MPLSFPKSFILLVICALAFMLQMFPVIGIFMMFAMAPFWSVILVNAAMLGIAREAQTGKVDRAWLVVPALFYGGYYAAAISDRVTMHTLASEFATLGAHLKEQFDPNRQALAVDSVQAASWLVQNTALPVAYSVKEGRAEGYLSYRLMELDTCDEVQSNRLAKKLSVRTHWVSNRGAKSAQARSFCVVSMPERPQNPVVHVSRSEDKTTKRLLPLTRITTTVTLPGGQRHDLPGGWAKPLLWLPVPVLGCALNSGAARWECTTEFWRSGYTPISDDAETAHGGAQAMANALGLEQVGVDQRRASNADPVLAKITALESETLTRQLAHLDAIIADPAASVGLQKMDVLWSRPDLIEGQADALMGGLARAVDAPWRERRQTQMNGLLLAHVISGLPAARFSGFGPQILALYAAAAPEHWLWRSAPLLRRLGDLGEPALAYLTRPKALTSGANRARIEGLCRIGAPARTAGGPLLLEQWSTTFDGWAREAAFVALRRLGITPPPLREKRRQLQARFERQWADISPTSPPEVCAVRTERRKRQLEKYSTLNN